MGKQQHQTAEPLPFGLSAGNIQIDDRLSIIGKVAELSLPDHQSPGLCRRVAVFKAQDAGFGEQAVIYQKRCLGLIERVKRYIFITGIGIEKNTVALAERTPRAVLTAQTDGIAFCQQRSKGEYFGIGPVNGVAFFNAVLAFFHETNQFLIQRKPLRKCVQLSGQCDELFFGNACFKRVVGIRPVKIFPIFIKRVLRVYASAGFNRLKSVIKTTIDFLFQGIRILFSDDAHFQQLLGITHIQRKTFSNPIIHLRLSKIGLIALVVAVSAKADDIDYNILFKCFPVIESHPDRVHSGFRIFSVNMKNRDHQHFGHVRGITCGSGMFRECGITDLIVDYEVDRAAGSVPGEL